MSARTTAPGPFHSLLRHASLYTASNIINRAFPFLLLPFLTYYLSPEQYGIFVLFQVVVNLLIPLIGLSSEAAAARAYVILPPQEHPAYVSSMLFVAASMTILLSVAELAMGHIVASFLSFPVMWLPVGIIVAFGEVVKNLNLALWQIQKQVRKYVLFNITQATVRFVASLLPVVLFSDKLSALLWGYSVSLAAFSVAGGVILVRRKYVVLRVHREHLVSFLKYGLPLVVHSIGAWLQGMADRVIVTRRLGLAETGIYSVGYSIGMGVGLVQDAFNRAWVPFFFEGLKKNEEHTNLRIVHLIILYAIGMLTLALGLALAAPFIFPILGPKYATAQKFVVWIAFAYAFNGIYKMFTNFIFYSKEVYILSIITLSSGVFNVILSYVLVGGRGVIGAAYASLVTQIVMCVVVFWAARRLSPMPWRKGWSSFFSEVAWRVRRFRNAHS